jgi:hypothetical protein
MIRCSTGWVHKEIVSRYLRFPHMSAFLPVSLLRYRGHAMLCTAPGGDPNDRLLLLLLNSKVRIRCVTHPHAPASSPFALQPSPLVLRKVIRMKPVDRSAKQIEGFRIGWREWIALPELGKLEIKAKIDTGARTSALHAVDLHPLHEDGRKWIEFRVPMEGHQDNARKRALVVDERNVKNTGGIPERRFIIETALVLGMRHWRIEMSLADREKMEFPVILGRTAIRGRKLFVDPGRSFLAGRPQFNN